MRLDDLIREGLAEGAGRARFDSLRWAENIVEASRAGAGVRLRRAPRPPRRWVAAAAVAGVVLAGIGLPLALLAGLGGRDQAVRPGGPTSGHKTQADVDDGLSIQIPEPWTFHQDPSGPDDPRTIFAVGSWTFTTGGDCAPVAAQEELPADGVLFWLIEYSDVADPADFPERPEHFELDEGTYAQYECSLVPSYLIRFRENLRYFQVHVAFGPQASESLEPEVVRALESIQVTAPVPDSCPADTGPWSDPDCPRSAWTRAVVEEAGYEVTGDTGSALVAEGLGGEFGIWTTSQDFTAKHLVEEEGYREAYVIDDVLTYSDGVRMVWMVQGLAVWVSGWQVGEPAPGEPPPGPIVADLVDASQDVDYDAIDTR